MADFNTTIAEAYRTEGAALDLGRGVHDGALAPEAVVAIPLRMMNRHGLVAGATGTGKTITLQTIAEQLSAAGVAVFAADVKGDVSGVATPGAPGGPAEKRMGELGLPFAPAGFPVEYLSLGGIGPGVPVRATVSDFGPQLLAKVLDANETQEQSLGLVFHYADQKGLPLLDLSDLRALLTFLESDAGKEELEGIGGLASSTVGVLLRSLVGLETGGGTEFFGEPQLDIADLLRLAPDGRGVISCLELPAVQDRPKLFSTALMWLLAELFEQLPEAGDLDKPKLVFFFDEAHLLFNGATKAFLESVTQTVRLIRSKGVGVFFVTQVPDDVPGEVLGQLGNRVQHAMRAFTPDDAKALKAAASTYPTSDFYDVEELLTQMGIGEAAVTILSEDGVPTPVVHTRLRAPASRMGPADDVDGAAKASPLFAKYGTRAEAESARERLAARLEQPEAEPDGGGPEEGSRRAAHRPEAQAGARPDRGRRRGLGQVPHLARGQGPAEEGDARGVRDAAQADVNRVGVPAAASPRPIPPFTEEHDPLRAEIRAFVAEELRPHAGDWEREHWFPDSVFTRMAERGLLGLKYPKEYGGRGGGYVEDAVLTQELSRCGSGGLAAGIGAHIGIATPPIWKFGTEDQKQRFLAPAVRGERIAALGITEPGAGSDVAGLRTFARRVDGGYVVNGSKTYITNGVRADFVVTAVKTTEEGGHHGISFLVLEKGMEGFTVAGELEKLGWHASDTGELHFDDVFVPEENLLGEENRGFYLIMANFQWERLLMALGAVGSMESVLERVVEGASGRHEFRQTVAELALKLEASRCSHRTRALPVRERARRHPRGDRGQVAVAALGAGGGRGGFSDPGGRPRDRPRAARHAAGPDRRRHRRGDEGDPRKADRGLAAAPVARRRVRLVRPAPVLVEKAAGVLLAAARLVALHAHPVEQIEEQHRGRRADEHRAGCHSEPP